jgi:hypothetical protein
MNGKFVTCHWCGHPFSYRIVRSVAGRDVARAEERLRRVLHTERDAVPCPECGRFQPDMLPLLRESHKRPLLHAGLAVLAFGSLICAAAFLAGSPVWRILTLVPAAGVGMVALWVWCVRRFNPNAPSGVEARRAAGQKRAEEAVPRNPSGVDYIAGTAGTIDVRYMVVYPVGFQ